MTKKEWQMHYGLEDSEMVYLSDIIDIFSGRIICIENKIIRNIKLSPLFNKLIKGIGFMRDKKIGNYKFKK